MIELGDGPLHSSDTGFIRADRGEVVGALTNPFAYAAFWSGVRTTDHRLSGEGALAVGDAWRMRALVGITGVDADVTVTDLRTKDQADNVWMDWRGHVDPAVGVPLARQPLEAEGEWYLRDWRVGVLATLFWRVRADPRRRQERLLLCLRRLGWRAITGLKQILEVGTTDWGALP